MKQGIWIVIGCVIGAGVGAVVARQIVSSDPAPPKHNGNGVEVGTFDIGMSAVFAGDHETALASFEKLEREEPKFRRMDQVLFWKGFSLRALDRYGAAIEVYDRLTDEFPKSARAPEAAFEAANILEQELRRPKDALLRYKKARATYPGLEHKALVRIGFILEELKQYDLACKSYPDSWSSAGEKNLPDSNWNVQQSRSRHGFIQQNSDFDRKPLALYTEAETLERNGKFSEAVAKLNELVRLFPKASLADDALARIVRLGRANGMAPEAKAAFENLKKNHANSAAFEALDR